jgi:1-acyl-sn-glycerol-3-phosphate acyltransferase
VALENPSPMLRFLPMPLRGAIATLILALNTIFWCSLLFIMAFVKFLLPFLAAQKVCRAIMHAIAANWIGVNGFWMRLVQRTEWSVEGMAKLNMRDTYLVTSNHQSWADIFALQYQFNRRLPMLKFFLKKELIWVPVIGPAWWALEFPFMKRYSKEYLAKHPEKKGQDLATTRKACERYKTNPVSVFNFLEGTRFTPAKHAAQKSPYRYLLKPKAGGIAFVLDAMGDQLKSLVNVTIHYPDGAPGFWALLSGKLTRIVIRIEQVEIPREFLGKNYDQDENYRREFQLWVSALWECKDALLAQLHAQYPARAG